MHRLRLALLPLLALALGPAALAAQTDPSRLYGRITTPDGSLYEGFIRWDKNEAGWFDILSGDKRVPERNREQAERLLAGDRERDRVSFEFFGIEVRLPVGHGHGGHASSAQSGIRFGHISSLEVVGSNRALLLLKSGEEVEYRGGGDIGRSVRDIIVEDPRRGRVELEWSDVRTIDFMTARVAERPPSGDRLHGTLRTRDGRSFTGYVAWDVDEVFTTDELDGEERGRDREIPFGEIRAIARESRSSAQVYLRSGQTLMLSGSNDVNHSNRDILIADPALGEVRIEWEDFDRIEFTTPPSRPEFGTFDGGRRLAGTVTTADGQSYTGTIRWDNDEEFTWEILDGTDRGVAFDIEFGAIERIDRRSSDAALVRLKDGRSFELSGSNDVDEDNKGIFITLANGQMVAVPWREFRRVRFSH